MLTNRQSTLFPTPINQKVSTHFIKCLDHVVNGELGEVKKILDNAAAQSDKRELRSLLLPTGCTLNRCGVFVVEKTLLACALGEGDPEMVALLKTYFKDFVGCKEELEKQLAPYRYSIESMLHRPYDDLNWLMDVLRKSSLEDVKKELEKDTFDIDNNPSELGNALDQFRKMKLDATKRSIASPDLHCNYNNLVHAYDLFDDAWDNKKLVERCREYYYGEYRTVLDYSKYHLFCKQIVGFIQLVEMGEFERYAFARGQVNQILYKNEKLDRSMAFSKDDYRRTFLDFPDSLPVRPTLGLTCWVTPYGSPGEPGPNWGGEGNNVKGVLGVSDEYKSYIEHKKEALQNLCKPAELLESAPLYKHHRR